MSPPASPAEGLTARRAQMSWHLGYPLSQTVLTSVYVEALLVPCPASTELAQFVRDDGCGAKQQPMLRVLRAYCLAMIKACGYVNERIKSEHFYEASCPAQKPRVGRSLTPSLGRRLCHQHVPPDPAHQPAHA